ncbi:MAG: hypothetical protein ACRDR6_00565 [Pseudonocardiaceae bacterium]
MEFWLAILVLLRRKVVALSVLLFSLSVAAAAYVVMPIQYVSSATTVLTTSVNGATLAQAPAPPTPRVNPLYSLDGMATAASILIEVLSTQDVAHQLGVVKGGATTFTVSDGSAIPQLLGSTGPFIVIEGHSTSAASARDIVARVEQRLRDELLARQKALDAPPATFISLTDVVPPTTPEAQYTRKLEVAAGVLLLGLIASTGVAYFFDKERQG